MTYLERYFAIEINQNMDRAKETERLIRYACPSAYFGVRKDICRKCGNDEYSSFDVENMAHSVCVDCWNREVDLTNPPMEWCNKRDNIRNNPQFIKFFDDIQYTNYPKQELVLRIANEILDSEAFMEGYPATNDSTELQKILTHVLWKNRVSTEAGRKILLGLAEHYKAK